jgi:hypothetical protein
VTSRQSSRLEFDCGDEARAGGANGSVMRDSIIAIVCRLNDLFSTMFHGEMVCLDRRRK